MAYLRTYKNKYGAILSSVMVYTAKDKAIQAIRAQNKPNTVYPRMFRAKDRNSSIRYFVRSGNPEIRALDTLIDRLRDLERCRLRLAVTRLVLAGKKPYGYTLVTSYGESVGMHLSGKLEPIQESINRLEYELTFLWWVMRALNPRYFQTLMPYTL